MWLRKRVANLETLTGDDHKLLVAHVDRCDKRMRHAIRVLYAIAAGVGINLLTDWLTSHIHVAYIPIPN